MTSKRTTTMNDPHDDNPAAGLVRLQSALVVADHRRKKAEVATALVTAERERADAQEHRIAELERKLKVTMRAVNSHSEKIGSLQQQIRGITAAVLQLQASHAPTAGRMRHRDGLDDALERELHGD